MSLCFISQEIHAFGGGGMRGRMGHAPMMNFIAGALGSWGDEQPVSAVAISSTGDFYIAMECAILKMTATGVVTSFAGSLTDNCLSSLDGTGTAAKFEYLYDITIDASNNVYVIDYNACVVRKITPAGVVTTLAGTFDVCGYADGTGPAAKFSFPAGLIVDSSGNVFVADQNNCSIRKITSSGVVTTFAGSTTGLCSSTNGTGTAATFSFPYGITMDSSGNFYVAETMINKIRKITPAAVVTTLAGAGIPGSTDATGTSARFRFPVGVAVDSTSGNVYVADTSNSTIRKITSAGVVTTLAGTASTPGYLDGSGAAARFDSPAKLTMDNSGNIYAVSSGAYVRKITPAGVVTTVMGPALYGFWNGTASQARLGSTPVGLAINTSGDLYIANLGNVILRMTANGLVNTFAGTYATSGTTNATGTAARFNGSSSLVFDSSGNSFITDTYNYTIRKMTSAGVVTTFAGLAGTGASVDGTAGSARFMGPSGIAIDASGNLYVADAGTKIRKITPAAVVTTFAGSGSNGSADGTGTAASFYGVQGLAVDTSGNVYAADVSNNIIRKITSAGVVTTLAGTAGVSGSADGTGASASFNFPSGIAIDSSGNLYVPDNNNYTIRKITSTGVVTTFAGTAGQTGQRDGVGSSARFRYLRGITIDSSNNLYITDDTRIRKITPNGAVITIAGPNASFENTRYSNRGSSDGGKTQASFYAPFGFATDSTGNIFVADSYNHSIRKVTPAGVVTTFAGTSGTSGSTDATGASASFNFPSAIAIDSSDNLYVADTYNNTVRKITSAGVVTTLAGSAGLVGSADGSGSAARFFHPQGIRVDSAGNIYVSDTENHSIRKVTSGGSVTTIAGTSGTPGSSDGTTAAALFTFPTGIVIDTNSNIFVSDTGNNTIRKITSGGVVTTLAGSAGLSGYTDGIGSAARFDWPKSLTIDSVGNLYVADVNNNAIRKITPSGKVSFDMNPNSLPDSSRKNPVILNRNLKQQQTAFGAPAAVHIDRGRMYLSLGNQIFYLPVP